MTKLERLDDEFRAGVGAGVGTKLDALIDKVNAIVTAFNAHLQDGSHTAAANQTGANVTANTVDDTEIVNDLGDEVHE